ncbi:MAG: hypothetical protein K8R40_10410 [Anaerolineaceae bacterium]|nr:hypothetical protein [Anaerolineaceae bacterium]
MNNNPEIHPEEKKPLSLKELLFMPLGCLFQLSNPLIIILLVCLLAGGAWFLHFSSSPINSIFYSTSNMEFTKGFGSIEAASGDKEWQIRYEFSKISTFTGYIRHNSAINEKRFPMLTHDVLITSGDFSEKDKVNTSVRNHHFLWVSLIDDHPKGTINLLHTIPINEEIYQLLGSIEVGDTVIIKGREVYKVEYLKNGEFIGYWSDSGCNTLVVTEVKIKD